MARAFKRKGARFVARLDEDERFVVVGLLEQTHEFLAPTPREQTGDAFEDLVGRLGLPSLKEWGEDDPEASRDPALERLFPSAHPENPGLAVEFRRLTEHGLRERKAANLATAISALQDADDDKVSLDQEQAHAMVVALTDVRLVLGERLGLRTDDDADALQDRLEDASEDDPQLHLAACYDFLTWLQESLIQGLMA
ncbi:MAG: hypothetical protein QOF35_141 [Actinomycetota bacterium]|nr:hypothetical protein [Actinomycetota bacterium]